MALPCTVWISKRYISALNGASTLGEITGETVTLISAAHQRLDAL